MKSIDPPTHLLSTLKSAHQREKELSIADHLTGASNSRHFYEVIQRDVNRLERNQLPFTIAYLDVDNFKSINDTFGHAHWDLVLKAMASSVKSQIRKTDLIARLGGDKLALFFPDTNHEAANNPAQNNSVLSNEMVKNNWADTFSIGVVTCAVAPSAVNELIKAADDLMYTVKQNGKNMVKYSV